MTQSWFGLFILCSVIACDTFECSQIPRLRLKNGTVLLKWQDFIIEYGNPLELLCTGNAVNLYITKEGERVEIDTVNETTVRFFTEKPERQLTYYSCIDFQSNNSTAIIVLVDSLPSVTDFRCKSKNLEYLNCTWTSLSIFAQKFLLYYIQTDIDSFYEKTFLICSINAHYDSLFCLWDRKNPWIIYRGLEKELSFVIESCNDFGCFNQSYAFDHAAVIKPDPPKLYLIAKSSRNALFEWKIPEIEIESLMGDLNVEQRVLYCYFGGHEIQYETVTFEYRYYFELKLPCAGTFYEVRFSIKLKAAVGEEFWSDDAVVTFVTDPDQEDLTAVDPRCTRPRVTINSDVMQYVMEQFRDNMEKQQNELKESIRSLKRRVEEKK